MRLIACLIARRRSPDGRRSRRQSGLRLSAGMVVVGVRGFRSRVDSRFQMNGRTTGIAVDGQVIAHPAGEPDASSAFLRRGRQFRGRRDGQPGTAVGYLGVDGSFAVADDCTSLPPPPCRIALVAASFTANVKSADRSRSSRCLRRRSCRRGLRPAPCRRRKVTTRGSRRPWWGDETGRRKIPDRVRIIGGARGFVRPYCDLPASSRAVTSDVIACHGLSAGSSVRLL
jgi:hypothetical protein